MNFLLIPILKKNYANRLATNIINMIEEKFWNKVAPSHIQKSQKRKKFDIDSEEDRTLEKKKKTSEDLLEGRNEGR